MNRALITGINGFVGPYLEKELKSNGYEVFGIGLEDENREKYYRVDVVNFQEVKKAVSEIKPTHIYHLSGISAPGFAEKHPELTNSVNVGGTKNLLDLCLELEDKPKILVVSSSHVYGEPVVLPISEAHSLNGRGVYAESRIKQEDLVKDYFSKLNIIVSRSFNHSGPGQPDNMVFPKLVKHVVEIVRGKRDKIEMGNNVKRDFTDVRDVVRAYRLLLEQDNFGVTVNICRGVSIALKDVIERAKVLSGLENVEVVVNPEFVRENDVMDACGDNSYLKSIVSWEPEIGYNKMIQDVYKYWDEII